MSNKIEITEVSQFDVWWKQLGFRVFISVLVGGFSLAVFTIPLWSKYFN